MGLTYIREDHRRRGITYETVMCDKCWNEYPASEKVAHGYDKEGYRRIVKPYTGMSTCLRCDEAKPAESTVRNLAVSVERAKVDSSNLNSIGYAEGRLIIEFKSGEIYGYRDVPPATFVAFTNAKSLGQFYHQQIKGKFTSMKLTGQCPSCGSAPELIGELCSSCGCATVRAVDTVHEENYPGEDKIKADLAVFQGAK